MFGKDQSKVIIVERREPLNSEQMRDAFNISDTSLIWRALVQIIDEYRLAAATYQADACAKNNQLALAANAGGAEALSLLLQDLEERRIAAKQS
jgi:hypothetical protein